jgi:hypothetical protein
MPETGMSSQLEGARGYFCQPVHPWDNYHAGHLPGHYNDMCALLANAVRKSISNQARSWKQFFKANEA